MKHLLKILLITLFSICTFSYATTKINIKVNNKNIASDVAPFITNGTTYVPIRFVADALNVDSVTWNSDSKSVSIKDSKNSILLFVNKNYAYVNKEYKNIANNALLANGRTFVPIRFISEILGAKVSWEEKNSTVLISTNTLGTTAPNKPSSNGSASNTILGSSSSNNSSSSSSSNKPNNSSTNSSLNSSSSTNSTVTNDEVYWLSRIIEAEAGGEPFKGKVAVGEVILNRVKSDEFPDTIWTVIFDKEFGVQFEPVANGTIYNTPSKESIDAAKVALAGSNYIGECLYFLNPTIASSNWIVKNREYYTTIANHDFYA